MPKTLYKLYYFYGGIGDRHECEGTFESMEGLLKHHKKRRNTPLYNYADFGKDYVEKFTVEEETEKCLYMPNETNSSKYARGSDANCEFLEKTLKKLEKIMEE